MKEAIKRQYILTKDASGLSAGSIIEGNEFGNSIFTIIGGKGIEIPKSSVQIYQPTEPTESTLTRDNLKKKFPIKQVLLGVAGAVLIIALLRYQKVF